MKQFQILRMRGIKPRFKHLENCPVPLDFEYMKTQLKK